MPLGASAAVGRHAPFLLGAFLAATGVDALVSILQARGIYHPFALVTQTAREATGAFAGNVGYLALALTLAAVGVIALALSGAHAPRREDRGRRRLLFGAALLVDQNLTAWSALAAGAPCFFFARFGRRAALRSPAPGPPRGARHRTYRPMRQRAREAVSAIRAKDWDRLVTYRLGAWAAAIEMTKERPWIGFGPGTYGAELVPHRLRAEIAATARQSALSHELLRRGPL